MIHQSPGINKHLMQVWVNEHMNIRLTLPDKRSISSGNYMSTCWRYGHNILASVPLFYTVHFRTKLSITCNDLHVTILSVHTCKINAHSSSPVYTHYIHFDHNVNFGSNSIHSLQLNTNTNTSFSFLTVLQYQVCNLWGVLSTEGTCKIHTLPCIFHRYEESCRSCGIWHWVHLEEACSCRNVRGSQVPWIWRQPAHSKQQ